MNVNITRILLIEDNAGDVRLLREMLKEDGDRHYDLTCTDRLSTGLKYLSEQHPDIIVVDMGLPDSQGLGTLGAVLSAAKGIPVVVLTGMNDESVGVQAVRQGAQDYLIKGSLDSRAIARVIDYAIERKRAEISLKASEERFRRLADNIPDIIYRFNYLPTWHYEYVSPASTVITGYTPEEYYADPELDAKLIHSEDKGLRQSMIDKPDFYERIPVTMRYIRKDGKTIWVERRQMAIRDQDGKVIALETIVRDVTEDLRAEEALQTSEKNFRNSIDSSPMGVRIVTADGETIYANNAMLRIYGYKNMEELRAKSIKERYTTESYHEFLERKEKRERGECVSSNYEINIMRKDGVIRHLEVFREEVLWGGEPQFQVLYSDITEQKLAQGALKESERKLRELVETAQEGILIADNNSKITFVNQYMSEMLGYTTEEMLGKQVFDFLDEKNKEIIRHQLERRRLGIKDEYDIEYLHKDGRRVYTRAGGNPLYDANGENNGSMAVVVDISALKQAEEHILHLNSVLNALRGINQLITLEKDKGRLLQKSCDLLVNTRGYDTAWVILTDGDGKFVFGVSSGIESKIFTPILKGFKKGKYTPCTNDLLQQKEGIILCPQLGSQHPDCPLDDLGDNLGNLSGRLEYEGRLYGVLSVQLPSKLAGNKEEQGLFNELTSDIAFALDQMAKAKQLEAAEAQAIETDKLRAIDRLRSELLANVSHELRTPLSAIKGFTSTMLRKDVKWSAKQREDFLQTMDQETDRLTRLISDILDMSRLDAGAMKLKQGKYLVSEIVGSVKGRLEVLTVHHRLEINVPEKLPAVFADEMRIGQVISNLVENAVKFSPAGSVINIAACLEKMNVVVSVIDHGEGMPKEVTEKLFNRFYQAEDVVTGRRSGTGLGLAICRGIIENHGGKIWVESKVKEGSKFSFSLPIIEEKTND